jgi:hypothetical protein
MYHRVWRWRQAESDSGTRTFTCRAARMARRAGGKEPDRVSSAIGIFPSELPQRIYILPWHINLSHSTRGTLRFNDCYGYETAEMNTVRMIDKV